MAIPKTGLATTPSLFSESHKLQIKIFNVPNIPPNKKDTPMKLKQLSCVASIGLALCLMHNASAQNPVPGTQNDYHWRGLGGDELWSNPNNWEIWTNLDNQNPAVLVDSGLQGVPAPGNPTTTFTGNVWLDPANGSSVMMIGAGDTEMPGVGNSAEVYNTIFGPEFGCTLNVYGTLTFDWTIAPYQPDPTPGLRSHINMYGNAYMYTSGASLNLGSGWWPVCEGVCDDEFVQ